jgi:hypothetical protein
MTRNGPPGRLCARTALLVTMLCQVPAAPLQAAATGEAYVDRVIDPAKLPAIGEEPSARYDDTGMLRALSLDATWGFTDFDGEAQSEHGGAASGFWDTALWGAFSLDAGLYKTRDSSDLSSFGAAWQRGLNLAGGWQVDNGLGVLNALLPALQRRQVRFFMPGHPVLGVASQWRQEAGLQLQASLGTPGDFTSGRMSGFEAGDGRTVAVGANWSLAPQWEGAASFVSTQGRDTNEFNARNGDSVFAAGAWEGERSRVQLNTVATRSEEGIGFPGNLRRSRSSSGAWVDGATRTGWFLHNYGLYHLDEDLSWAGELMSNDARGGYYRVSHQKMRVSWSAAIDHLQPVSGSGSDSTYVSGMGRYQATSRLGLGGSATARSAVTDAWTAQLFADLHNRLGITRAQLNLAEDSNDNSAWQATVTQSLPGSVGTRLSVAASHGQTRRSERGTTQTSSLALFGTRDLLARISVDGSAQASVESGPDAEDGLSANIGLNWQLDARWRLLATYSRSTTTRRNLFVLEPFPQPDETTRNIDTESFFVTLRYGFRGGQSVGVLGGAPGSPAGFILGTIFLDENEDGLRDGSEAGVANATVVLNDRFSVRTDGQGNFTFPMVATGVHSVRVLPDNLPLPWMFDDAVAERSVEVGLRQQVQLNVPARRSR